MCCSLSFPVLARFRSPLSGEGSPLEKPTSNLPKLELCLFGTGIALDVWCRSLQRKGRINQSQQACSRAAQMFHQRPERLFYPNPELRLANRLYPEVLKPQTCLMPYELRKTPQRTALLKAGKIVQGTFTELHG